MTCFSYFRIFARVSTRIEILTGDGSSTSPNQIHHNTGFPPGESENLALKGEAEAELLSEDASAFYNLYQRGTQLYKQFQLSGGITVLEESVDCMRKVLTLQPLSPSDRFKTLISLGIALPSLFEQTGRAEDLEEAIQLLRDAFALPTPPGLDRCKLLNALAVAILTRFERTGEMDDLDEGIKLLHNALALLPPDHPDRSALLNNLAAAVCNRFQQTGRIIDLEDGIRLHGDALSLRPLGHPDRSTSLNNLASTVWTRFKQTGNEKDLEEAIQLHRDALALRPIGNPDRFTSLNNVAVAVKTQYELTRKMADLEEQIELHREALALCSPGHLNRSASLNNLANAVYTRFKQIGLMSDLEEGIRLHREALALRPDGHPHRSTSLSNLGNTVLVRFRHIRQMDDLEEAIKLHRAALILRPLGHPDRSGSLNHLSTAVCTRFEESGGMVDLEEGIQLLQEALSLSSLGHPDFRGVLSNLADAICTRFQQTGRIADLEQGIQLHRTVLVLCPVEHPDYSSSLSHLASALHIRFEQTGIIADLEEEIQIHQNALSLRQLGHPDRSNSLNNLAVAIRSRFKQTGKIADLEEGIRLHREALKLRSLGRSDRSSLLINLADALCERFQMTGRVSDLEEGIHLHREAINLRPLGHPDRSGLLSSIGSALCLRFEYASKEVDLEEGIRFHREALALCPLDHSDRPMLLNNLASVLWTRFIHAGLKVDFEEGIQLLQLVLSLRPFGHQKRFLSLNNLANAFQTRFRHFGKPEDLLEASRLLSDAEDACSIDHPLLGVTWRLSAINHLQLYHIDSDKQHISTAIDLLYKAAMYQAASVKDRLKAALHWSSAARRYRHESLLVAYSTTLNLFNRYLIASPSVEHQLRLRSYSMATLKSLALDAAATAIEKGQLRTAVEFLEQGRTLLWSEIRRFRHPIEVLRGINPELAAEFETLSRQLELLALSPEDTPVDLYQNSDAHPNREGREISDSALTKLENKSEVAQRQYVTFEDKTSLYSETSEIYDAKQREHRRLSQRWDDVVEEIRRIKGFSDFLKAVPFETLQAAAIGGPIVVVNISDYRSDAIVVCESSGPILVPLPKATPDTLSNLCTRFHQSLASRARHRSEELCENLGVLWKVVVGPVVDQLGKLGLENGSRIWWCPTSYSCGLPLHAAGPFIPDQHGRFTPDHQWLPDLYVSSYTSTLSVLMVARSNEISDITNPSLLVVAQPQSLKYVEEEVRRIMQFGRIVKAIIGDEATRDAVLQHLPHHPLVHFACHSSKHPEPFHSSFKLWDEDRLELLDLIKGRLPNAHLAFLASCHGAATDIRENPDEVIHLAAAFQFCGYKGVIGTLWEMQDADGPAIAEVFYGHMFREEGKVDVKDSAQALTTAIQEMKKRTGLIGQWINFVHIGV